MTGLSDFVGLYVHIPFCSVKCFYCDFTAFAGQSRAASRYLAALEREAARNPSRQPKTVYIGGGTPSELSTDQIDALYAGLRRAYPGLSPLESTFEANPESLTAEKLTALRRAGVDRLSIGLQTAEDKLLKEIGRKHSRADFLEVYQAARAAGGFQLSVDLMYGLPNQSLSSCLESLDFVLSLEPDHLSLYGLQVEDRTLFAKRGVEPDEDSGREMLEKCLDRLDAEGFHHYEISNFARPGRESKHNMIYWRGGEYVGLGCGAASYLDGERTTNSDRLNDYMAAVEAGRRPIAERERVEGKEKLGERAFLGLRLIDGFVPGAELEAAFAGELARLESRGLLARRGATLRLTREGVFLANQVFREFVPPYAARAEVPA